MRAWKDIGGGGCGWASVRSVKDRILFSSSLFLSWEIDSLAPSVSATHYFGYVAQDRMGRQYERQTTGYMFPDLEIHVIGLQALRGDLWPM